MTTRRYYMKFENRWVGNGQCDMEIGGKIVGAFSTSHSMVRALPAMSLNSAPGFRERIKVAAGEQAVSNTQWLRKRSTRTAKDDT
jgi:hypothetical protein